MRYDQRVLDSARPPRLAIRFTDDDAGKEVIAELEARALDALIKHIGVECLRADGRCVIHHGRDYIDLEQDTARKIARMMLAGFKRLEEIEQAERIAFDGAILARAGVPIGLSSDPKIVAEVIKEAAWNTVLRKCMPGGVKSEEVWGVPSVIVHPAPKGEQ